MIVRAGSTVRYNKSSTWIKAEKAIRFKASEVIERRPNTLIVKTDGLTVEVFKAQASEK